MQSLHGESPDARPPRLAARVVIFGTGSAARQAWEQLSGRPDISVVGFLDNDERRWSERFQGLPVMAPAALQAASVDGILAASIHAEAMVRQLVELGIPRARIYTDAAGLLPTVAPALSTDSTLLSLAGPRPRIVNFQVNDVCNARCAMCHVWKQKRDVELSPEEFATLIANPFFAELTHVGITGGEPTLRRDLPDFYLALPDRCPKLTGASFITHGLDTDRALAAYPRVAEAYRARNLTLSGMVSLDGVGEVHDGVRGRERAFERATRTLLELNAAGVPTIAACTIVRRNVWGVWDLLEWGQARGIYVRFRVAEFIQRLYNTGITDEIRAFDDAEVSALISFFQTLIDSYEPDAHIRRTYASNIALLAGGRRRVSCPYQTGEAISVDCRGRFAACAPKGSYHALDADVGATARRLAQDRLTIKATHCGSCIHDCHDEWLPWVAEEQTVAAAVDARLQSAPVTPVLPPVATARPRMQRVLILGWYGTETIGDLGILAGITSEYREAEPGVEFVVASLFPDYTRHNLRRLGLRASVVSYGDPDVFGDLWNCDTVIIGGGPLMDIPKLASFATMFERARLLGRRTVVECCGVGPVNRPETADAIRRIVAASDEVRVRDAGSAALLRTLGIDASVAVASDPATRWVRSTGIRHSGSTTGPIAVFARALTSEYPQATSPEAATAALSEFLRRLCDWFPERIVSLHAMHHFPVGGDDRLYARRLSTIVGRANVVVDEVPRTPEETLGIMAGASFVVCMRFHSLVFAHGIGAPLAAIDYTDGGKVRHFLNEHGLADRGLGFTDLEGVTRARLVSLGVPEPMVVS